MKNNLIDLVFKKFETPEGEAHVHNAMKNSSDLKWIVVARLLRGEISKNDAQEALEKINAAESHDDTEWKCVRKFDNNPVSNAIYNRRLNKYWLQINDHPQRGFEWFVMDFNSDMAFGTCGSLESAQKEATVTALSLPENTIFSYGD